MPKSRRRRRPLSRCRYARLAIIGLMRVWRWLLAFGRVLWITRFSVASVLIGIYALMLNDQTQEVLREFAAREGFVSDLTQYFFFFAACFAWAWNSWGYARTLTTLEFPCVNPPWGPEIGIRVWLPRILGSMAAFAVPIAIFIAARAYTDVSPPSATHMQKIAGWATLGAVVFTVYVIYRRGMTGQQHARHAVTKRHRLLRSLPPFDLRSLIATLSATIILFLLFAIKPALTAPWFGAAPILLFALASWIPFGSYLVYQSLHWRKVPLFTILIIAAVVFGTWNDNHRVRTLDAVAQVLQPGAEDCDPPLPSNALPQIDAAVRTRYPLCGYARLWLEARRKEIENTQGGYPVYLVAAAGGGIRAAYWTAGVLAFRQDLDPDFARQTFVISGVSGGSLGAVVYAGLLRTQEEAHQHGATIANCGGTFIKQALASCATTMLGGDFLAPALGSMLYPDLVQRFLPWPIAWFDRAEALEIGWEARWRKVMGRNNDWLADSYETLANPNPDTSMPLLLLNSTSVESGKRALISPLPVAPLEFPDTIDVRRTIDRALRNSTAAHLSARFMYVSPAATITVSDGQNGRRVWGHLVDGGYFENSGAATLLDVLVSLQRAATETKLDKHIVPVVLILSNNPDAPKPTEDPDATTPEPLKYGVEARAPIQTLLQTREGRGSQAQAVLKRTVEWRGTGKFELYQPQERGIPLPLGWMLAGSARSELDRQIIQNVCRNHPEQC